jgi:hypothetical protein
MMKEQISRIIHSAAEILLEKWRFFHFHPHTLLMQRAQAEAADYAQANMKRALVFRDPRAFLLYAQSRATAPGLQCEFGVASGTSIGWLAGATRGEVHGFDSFEGLPEDWAGRHEPKGAYSTGGRLPPVPANVRLYKGWFDKTVPGFLASHPGAASFLHIDCDLYSSTKCVFDLFAPRLVPGTVIAFDEYFNYVSWREHEHKAFQELVAARGINYEYIAWCFQQVAVVITEIKRPA